MTAWRKIGDLRDPERLKPWLAQIARNAALELRRKLDPPDETDETLI
jgi:DNA-directed RNA polymerase specialized sigma24 family protein